MECLFFYLFKIEILAETSPKPYPLTVQLQENSVCIDVAFTMGVWLHPNYSATI